VIVQRTTARVKSLTGLIHRGRTIVAGRETLKADFEKLFAEKK
jgi:hypothetical protein